MLRGGDKSGKAELLKQIDEQRKQIAAYERKLKDVVRAYKGLNAEKDALQATVEALSTQDGAPYESSPASADESVEGKDMPSGSESDTSKRISADERVETLKRSLVTLTTEKTRREAAFQADKRALLAENEALKERIQKAADETEARAEELEQHMKELRAKIKRIEEDRERELADHGSVLAEMQQRYAKERANCEQMERQIAELYKKLNQREEIPVHLETKMNELKSELKAANEEATFWKKKAEKTPTVQMLESELQNLKEGSQRELAELKSRISSVANPERDARLHELEERLHDMTAKLGDLERSRLEECQKMEELRKVNEKLLLEKSALIKELSAHRLERSDDPVFVGEKFIELAKKLRMADESVNFYELLNLEEPSVEQKRRYEQLQDEFERYKLKAQAVLKCRNLPEGCLDGSGIPRVSSLPVVSECSSCASADAELRHMRSVIASLHEKMQNLEIDHANAKKDHEEKCSRLQGTIAEMQLSQANLTSELRHQMQQKVCEVEEEMQKQRARTLEVLAEKEKELEVTKTILVSIRSQQMNAADPVDPTQANVSAQPVTFRKSRSREFGERLGPVQDRRRNSDCAGGIVMARPLSDADSYSSFVDESHIEACSVSPTTLAAPLSLSTASNATEARNIFYEQQLAKREKELIEMRQVFVCFFKNALETSESNMREIQQASLTKDLQHYEIIEKLKDEIRSLEGKLTFYSGDANLEYLRNVFVQLIYCDSSSDRKHILKAIGTVLKLSSKEMKLLEKHSF
ncbi:GRIP and coiled-coil domain-containing protein 1 [Toxocara canis]|uniref:GRIP and coiled-coil domain-containing protein 1 n=1 Tax=Toxocara canis TaxID=6265 RepID=A0A0B2VFI0_TOXCA|nr:GRIP and coiled-coil domain-containing protein 1 [Toxocara canis]